MDKKAKDDPRLDELVVYHLVLSKREVFAVLRWVQIVEATANDCDVDMGYAITKAIEQAVGEKRRLVALPEAAKQPKVLDFVQKALVQRESVASAYSHQEEDS